ncbi:MAG: hypothetical protein AAF557_26650 [Pseudomonadota bacterium]
MKRSALILMVGLASGAAGADVTMNFDVKGYDDFFDRCEFKLITAPSVGIDSVSVIRWIQIPEKGGSMCRQDSRGFTCQSTDDFEYTCDEMKSIAVIGTDCRDVDGNAVDCGAVSLGKTTGDDIEAVMPDMAGDAGATTQVIAATLGYDGFFDACKIGTAYISSADIDYAEIKYRVDVGDKGHAMCTGSAFGGISSGWSCSTTSNFDYTCAEVTGVKIETVTCEKGDAEVDCGSVSVRTPEPELIESGL